MRAIASNGEAKIISEGKIEITWNRNDPGSVAVARNRFLNLTRLGWMAFATLPDGRRKHVPSFDSSLEKVVLLRLVEGG